MVEGKIEFFSPFLPIATEKNDYSFVPGREGNEISAFPLSVSPPPISAFQELMVWFIEPSRAALLLSLKTFYLSVRSTYSVVWDESFAVFKAFPPTMYHFKRPMGDL